MLNNRISIMTILVTIIVLALGQSSNVPLAHAREIKSPAVLSNMPLMFIEQQPNRYQVQLNGQSMWFTQDSLWLTTKEQNIKLTFQAANPHARLEPLSQLETHISNFRGNDPAKWQTDMPVYSGVRYHDLYPGQDLIITSEQGKLAWQWETVGAGLVPARVADSQTGQAQGLPLPGNVRVVVDNGSTAQTLTLDPNQSLTDQLAAIISPQTANSNSNPHIPRQQGAADLVWSTFLGGSQGEQGTGITVDSAGYVYAVGYSWSSDFPSTVNTYKPSDNGGVYVAKINPSGNGLVYLTFFGGNSGDAGVDIAIDSSGNAYVTGETWSPDFPTTPGAFSTVLGYYVAFVTKLNPTGTTLLYSTFLGSGGTSGKSIAVDSSGAAYITGRTQTSGFPVTSGAFDTSMTGANDAFVAKLNPSGTALVYATFLGGNNTGQNEEGNSIAVDNAGNAYVTGMTNSTDFPVTTGTFDTTFGGGTCGNAPNTYTCVDAFVAKINPTGTALSYSAFLGGSKDERGQGIALDTAGNAYITGFTNSSDFPTTTGAFDRTFGGAIDGFVAKVNATATTLTYSTFLGGSSNECWDDFGYRACDIAVDAIGNAYVVGLTESTDFPTTANAFDITPNGGVFNVFVAKFDTTGTSLTYGTYMGGTIGGSALYYNSIATDGVGNVYITGRTASTTFPTTSGAYDTTYNGGESDSYIAKLAIGSVATPTPIVTISPTSTPTLTPIPVPGVSLSPQTWNFGNQTVGVLSSVQPIILQNSGLGTLSISNITIGGDFAQTNNCPATLSSNGSCIINVTFNPTLVGLRSGTLIITDNASGSPHSVALSGTGVTTPITVTPPTNTPTPTPVITISPTPTNTPMPTNTPTPTNTPVGPTITPAPTLQIVTNVQASDGTFTDKVQISWGLVNGATSYKLYRAYTATGNKLLLNSVNTNTYDDFMNGGITLYYYWVQACNNVGCSDYSPADTGWYSGGVPMSNTTLQATDGSYSDKVRVTWNVSLGAQWYSVYRATQAQHTSQQTSYLGRVDSGTVYDDLTAESGVTYYYSVNACNGYGCGGTGEDTGYRSGTPPLCVPTLVAPASGALMDNGRYDFLDNITWDFDWSDCANTTTYELYLSRNGQSVYDEYLTVSTRQYLYLKSYIGTTYLNGWGWQVRARINGQWGNWSELRPFTIEPPDSDPPMYATPTPTKTPTKIPTPTLTPTPTKTPTPPPATGLNLTVSNIEVSQAIQTLNNSVPLVANRPTIARVYINVQNGTNSIPNVTARLRASRNGVELSGSPLTPFNPNGIMSAPMSINRENWLHTLNFQLPSSWTSAGQILLWAEVNPNRTVTEGNYNDNRSQNYTLTFGDIPPLEIVLIPVAYQRNGQGPVYRPSLNGGNNMGLGMLQRILPVSQVKYTVHSEYSFKGDMKTNDGWSQLLREIANLRSRERASSSNNSFGQPKYYGVLPMESSLWGGLGYIGGPSSIGLVNQDDVAAHEIGHNIGLPHVNSASCGQNPIGTDPNYPYSGGSIGQVGIDVYNYSLIPATTNKDLMSYCWPKWISDYNYRKFYDSFKSPLRREVTPRQTIAAGLLISGRIMGDSGSLNYAQPISATNIVADSTGEGNYQLNLHGLGGEVIFHYTFEPTLIGAEDETAMPADFSFIVPFTTNLSALSLWHGTTMLTQLELTTTLPTLQVSQQANGNEVVLTWQVSDNVKVTVNYSADNGQTWQTLAVDLTANSFTLDKTQLMASADGLIEVIANNGAQTVREPLRIGVVADKAPIVGISGITQTIQLKLGEPLVLAGTAIDLEDGTLSEDKLTWSSSILGPLGTGYNLILPQGLDAGEHIITLGATDSAGNTAETTIQVVVTKESSSVYLPLIVK